MVDELKQKIGELERPARGVAFASKPVRPVCARGQGVFVTLYHLDVERDAELILSTLEAFEAVPLDELITVAAPLVAEYRRRCGVTEGDFDPAELLRTAEIDSAALLRIKTLGPGVHVCMDLPCPWDEEHGMQVTLESGRTPCGVGAAAEHL